MEHLILAAAGDGRRLGHRTPKALVTLRGRPLVARVLDTFAGLFSRAIVAAPPDRLAEFESACAGRASVVSGGATRGDSVRRAFEALAPADADLVCIHDAARPLVSAEEARAVVEAARSIGAAIAASPIADTVKRVAGSRRPPEIVETLDRSSLWAAATPQVFRADWLRAALREGREATDESALIEADGHPVAVVPVSRLAFKITTPEDLALAEAWLGRRS